MFDRVLYTLLEPLLFYNNPSNRWFQIGELLWMKKSWKLKLKHSYRLKSLHVHIRNYSPNFVEWIYLMSLIKTMLQLQIVSYYQSFAVFCIIRQNMDLRSVNHCTFQGQFVGVLNTMIYKCDLLNCPEVKLRQLS